MTVTQNVKVNFPAYTLGQTSINFTPTGYTPLNDTWGEHFSTTDTSGITYTLTDNIGNSWNSATGFIVNLTDGPYANGTTYAFTQTFKLNNTTIGSHTIRIRVTLGSFGTLRDANDVALNPQVIPPVSLTLSKQVQP